MRKALEYTQDEGHAHGVFIVMMFSLLTAVGCYAKYELFGSSVHYKDYRKKKKLSYPFESILNELLRRE